MHLSSKISSALLVSLCWAIAPVPSANSCVDSNDGPTTQLTLFNRSVIDLSNWMPQNYRFNANSASVADVPDYERNSREWATYLGKSVDWHDAYEILYNTKPDDFLNLIGQDATKAYPKNTFMRALVAPDKVAALGYLRLAKQAEFDHFAQEDPWYEYDQEQALALPYQKKKALENLLTGFEDGLKTAKDDFLKQRNAYQLQLFYRYAGLRKESIKYYQKYFENDQTSVISLWALLHYAECIDNQVEAQFYFSRIYDLSPHKRARAHQLREAKLQEKVLNRAKNDHERATIIAYYAQKSAGPILDDLKVMFQIDPQNKFLPQLIAQEINKVEDWVSNDRLTPYIAGKDQPEKEKNEKEAAYEDYHRANLTTDLAYLRDLRTLIGQGLLSGALKNQKDFLRVATAHLFLIDRRPNEAQQLLRSVDAKASPAVKLQQKTGEWMLTPLLADVTNTNVKADLLARYQYLETQQGQLRNGKVHLSHMLFYLARAYELRGDKVTAWLLLNRAAYTDYGHFGYGYYGSIAYLDQFGSVADVERAVAFIKSGTKTPFEKWLISPVPEPDNQYSWEENKVHDLFDDPYYSRVNGLGPSAVPTANQLTELAGTIALRESKFEKALALYQQLPADYWQKNYEFNSYLHHNPIAEKCLLPTGDTTTTNSNKAIIVRNVLALQKGPQTAENLYLLAGAYFNMSYHGNAWMMTHYGKSIGETFDKDNQTTDAKDYYLAARALETYQLALDAKPTPSLKARIELMQHHIAFLIKQNDYEQTYNGKQPKYVTSVFRSWLKNARKADFWDALSTECPDLSKY